VFRTAELKLEVNDAWESDSVANERRPGGVYHLATQRQTLERQPVWRVYALEESFVDHEAMHLEHSEAGWQEHAHRVYVSDVADL
jgi:hypothetical protein